MQVFNAPPGWPTPDVDDWSPPPSWVPDPDWPPPPPGWRFEIDEALRMRPADMSGHAGLPRPQYVTRDDLSELAQDAADAVAMQVAAHAGRLWERPTTVLEREHDFVERAIDEAEAWVFDDLLRETDVWAQSQPPGSSSAQMAHEQMTTFRALRDGFHAAARRRIERVLEASTAPETGIRPAVPARWNLPADPLNRPVADSPADARRALAHVRQTCRRRAAWAWVHGAICLAGIAITIGTFEAAYRNSGGTYLVCWGAIIFGAINCARNWSKYTRSKEVAAHLEKRIGAPTSQPYGRSV